MIFAAQLHQILFGLPPFKGRQRVLNKLASYCTFVQSAYGPYLRVRPKDATNRMSLNGQYGTELYDIIRAMPSDGVYLDIGSNTGVYALVAGQHLTEGRAYAFEPNPYVFADIIANIDRNVLNNVTAFNFGLGVEMQVVEFEFRRDHSGSTSVRDTPEGRVSTGNVATALLMTAEAIGLKQRLSGRPVVCKIDVEGAELKVLQSLATSDALDEIDKLYIEIDPSNMAHFGDNADDVYALMTSRGFKAVTDRRGQAHYDEIFEAP